MITGLGRLELCKTLLGISCMKPEGPPARKQDVGRKHQFSPGSEWTETGGCRLLGRLLNDLVTVKEIESCVLFWP